MKKGKNKRKYRLNRIASAGNEIKITSDNHIDWIKKELEERYKDIDIDNKIDN